MGRRRDRIAKNLGVAQRADVKAIVDKANADTAVLRNQVIGTQQFDIKRAPTRLFESAMGNMVTDAMRGAYPGVEAAFTNSGGLRQDVNCAPPSARAAVRDHLGRDVRRAPVRQPHGDPHAHGRPAPGGVRQRLHAVLLRRLPGRDGPLPAGLGPQGHVRLQRPDAGRHRDVEDAEGIGGPQTPIGPADTVRLVTNDFMLTGGDGYTMFAGARTSSSRATTCCRSRSTTSRPTRRSARWSKAASSARSARSRRGPVAPAAAGPSASMVAPGVSWYILGTSVTVERKGRR